MMPYYLRVELSPEHSRPHQRCSLETSEVPHSGRQQHCLPRTDIQDGHTLA